MLPRSPLRLRIAAALALTCLLIVGALGFTLYTASEDMAEALIGDIVGEEMDYLVERHRQNPDFQPQQTSNLKSYIVRGPDARAQLPQHLRELAVGQHELYVDNGERHILVREEGGVRYVVAYEVGLHEQREREFGLLVALSVIAGAIASLAIGYWLSGFLVSQITELAQAVGSLAPGSPKTTLVSADQDPEIATLARAFDAYQADIDQLIRREQEFAANASHELRTPLTAIQTSCELLLAEAALPEKARARVLRMSEAARRMEEQIRALLFLARAQPLGGAERVALAGCVAEAVEPYRGEMSRKGLALEVAIEENAVLDLNQQALRFVLANLIRNAVDYTERGFVKIAYAGRRLTIEDSGRGITAEHLPRVFERFFRGDGAAEGSGVGLSIVKRVCDHYGWAIDVRSVPRGGSTFSITFPQEPPVLTLP